MKRMIPIILLLLLLTGCTSGQGMDGDGMVNSYQQIDQETAKMMMEADDGHVIVDVRRQDEYDAGHIPGAILIPNETITDARPEQLPELDQVILIYCRSGNRSKQAAQKLFDMGYTNVYEFGGINTWTGEIETGGKPAVLSFDSFDGGGPEYQVVLASDLVACRREKTYSKPDHEELDGAGFTITYTFTGIKPGETTMTVEERSPIGGNLDYVYAVKVDNDLNVTVELLTTTDLDAAVESVPMLVIAANDKVFYAVPEDNASAVEFTDKLSRQAIEVDMKDRGDFEKMGSLPWSLPRNDTSITTEPGDVMLYQGNQITVCCDRNTWELTQLARIEGVSREELLEAFGDGDVMVAFWIEWSE